MLGEKCNPSVIAEIFVTRPVCSSELHESQLLSPVKHPARYRRRSAEILDKMIAILERLEARQERLEARQIKVKEEVDDIQTHEPPIQGSFATVNTGGNPAPR